MGRMVMEGCCSCSSICLLWSNVGKSNCEKWLVDLPWNTHSSRPRKYVERSLQKSYTSYTLSQHNLTEKLIKPQNATEYIARVTVFNPKFHHTTLKSPNAHSCKARNWSHGNLHSPAAHVPFAQWGYDDWNFAGVALNIVLGILGSCCCILFHYSSLIILSLIKAERRADREQ